MMVTLCYAYVLINLNLTGICNLGLCTSCYFPISISIVFSWLHLLKSLYIAWSIQSPALDLKVEYAMMEYSKTDVYKITYL